MSNAALEGVVLLIAKPLATSELRMQSAYLGHGIVVGGTEGCLGRGGALDAEALIVVVVERVESIGIVDHYIEEGLPIGRLSDILALQGAPHHLHQLA